METTIINTSTCAQKSPTWSIRVEAGFSILEVLISLIILSLGLIGAVGMQATAMQSNKEARNLAIATTFGRELAERMRGNNSVSIQTTTSNNPYLLDVTLASSTSIPTPAVNCFVLGCPIVKDAASWDVADWQKRVQAALPSARVKVCFDQTPFDSAGKAQWDCTSNGDIAVLKMSWTRKDTAGTLDFDSSGVPIVVVPLTAGSSQ